MEPVDDYPPEDYPSAPESDPADVPQLTRAVVEDDERLEAAVDAFTSRDEDARGATDAVVDAQRVLRERIDDLGWEQGWPLVLRMEELMNARHADLAVRIAKWAFQEGERSAAATALPEAAEDEGLDAPFAVLSTGKVVVNARHAALDGEDAISTYVRISTGGPVFVGVPLEPKGVTTGLKLLGDALRVVAARLTVRR